MIPKIIWQTHEEKRSSLPLFMQEISNTWINLNPKYYYVYMSAQERRNEVIKYLNDDIFYYDRLNGMFQSDIWRYCMLSEYGGIYADMDSICIKSFDYFIQKKYNNEEVVATKIVETNKLLNVYSQDGYKINKKIRPNFLKKYEYNQFLNNANFACLEKSKIIKNILKDAVNAMKSDDFVLNPTIFSKNIIDNKNFVSFEMDNICIHHPEFKNNLFLLKNKNSLVVNYLGKEMFYSKLLNLID